MLFGLKTNHAKTWEGFGPVKKRLRYQPSPHWGQKWVLFLYPLPRMRIPVSRTRPFFDCGAAKHPIVCHMCVAIELGKQEIRDSVAPYALQGAYSYTVKGKQGDRKC